VVRQTTISYANFASGPVDRPSLVTVYDSNGDTAAKTSFQYDVGTLYGTTEAQHVAVPQGWSRGNVTGIVRYSAAGAYLVQNFTNYDTGNVRTATDVNGAVTTYQFSSATHPSATTSTIPLRSTARPWPTPKAVWRKPTPGPVRPKSRTWASATRRAERRPTSGSGAPTRAAGITSPAPTGPPDPPGC